ncbi:unnamed protein product, partial [Mesorhabditis spiculigera]
MDDPNKLVLWLRAGSDGQRMGGDPLSHHLFMLLVLKGQQNSNLVFEVRTVSEAKPAPDFKAAGLRKPPAAVYQEETYTHEDDIVELLERWTPRRKQTGADDATADLFRHFAYFIKDVNKCPQALLGELHRLDEFLGNCGTKFLAGDEPSFIDTVVLPRLHTIRISAQALKDFSIPDDLQHLWAYLGGAYKLQLFTATCPCDQEIILHWAERPDTSDISSQRRAVLYREKSTFTFTVPGESTVSSYT